MLWTEIMWGRAWLLTLLNGCRGESILLMPIRRKKLSARWSFKVSRVCEIQARCQSPQSRRKLSFDESEKNSIPKPRITAGQQKGSALRHIDESVTGEAKKLWMGKRTPCENQKIAKRGIKQRPDEEYENKIEGSATRWVQKTLRRTHRQLSSHSQNGI